MRDIYEVDAFGEYIGGAPEPRTPDVHDQATGIGIVSAVVMALIVCGGVLALVRVMVG